MRFSDNDIRAYLNGEMPAEAMAELEVSVAQDETLERRIISLDPVAAPVRDAFSPHPSAERLSRMRANCSDLLATGSRNRGSSSIVSGLVAAGFSGLVLGYLVFADGPIRPDLDADWKMQVASYQALYVEETVAAITSDPDAIARQFQSAEAAVGLELQPDLLVRLDQLTLKRAQILGYQDKPLVQIAFQAEDGTPFAFCVIRKDQRGGATQPEIRKRAGLASTSWESDTHGFLLIGGKDRDRIAGLATQLIAVF